jgi:hypothetical protein
MWVIPSILFKWVIFPIMWVMPVNGFSTFLKFFDKDDDAGGGKAPKDNTDLDIDTKKGKLNDIPEEKLNDISDLLDDDDVDPDKVMDFLSKGKVPGKDDVKTTEKKPAAADDIDNLDPDKKKGDKDDIPPESKTDKDKKPDNTQKTPEDKTDGDKDILVDDKYIESRPENEKEILRGIRNKNVDPQILKNYLAAEIHIADIKTGKVPAKTEPKQPALKSETREKLNTQKYSMIVKGLQEIYHDIPPEAVSDPEVFNEYANHLSQTKALDFADFRDNMKNITKNVEEKIERFVFLEDNWEKEAEKTISTDVDRFRKLLKDKYGIADEKELGIDLNLVDSENGKYNQYLFDNFIYNQDKTINPKVLQMINNDIPFVIPEAVYYKLLEANIEKINNIVVTKARTEGYERRIKNEPPPAQHGSTIPGADNKKVKSPESILDNPNATLEEIEGAEKEIENTILGGKRKK